MCNTKHLKDQNVKIKLALVLVMYIYIYIVIVDINKTKVEIAILANREIKSLRKPSLSATFMFAMS